MSFYVSSIITNNNSRGYSLTYLAFVFDLTIVCPYKISAFVMSILSVTTLVNETI